jgi:hypothetical protein
LLCGAVGLAVLRGTRVALEAVLEAHITRTAAAIGVVATGIRTLGILALAITAQATVIRMADTMVIAPAGVMIRTTDIVRADTLLTGTDTRLT